MPAKSPEALARKVQRRNEKNRKAAAARKAMMLPLHKITARRMMTRLSAGTTKAELRAMLAQAFATTAVL